MNYQTRPPLTATERARRAAVLAANRPMTTDDLGHHAGITHASEACDASEQGIADSAEPPADHILDEPNDERLYGQHAAEILRNAKRDVALASMGEDKISAFRRAATSLSEAVAGQWLPKDVIVDQLQDIAVAHNSFGLSSEDVQVIIAEAVECSHISVIQSPSKPPVAASQTTAGLDVVCMSDVRPTSIEYLWQNWLARGKVHVLAGEGGKGKTTLLIDWTARTTTGDRWPDGAETRKPGGVLILTSEDDVEDTIAPRLIAAGADMSRVFVIRSVRDEQNRRRGFSLQADLERLEAEIKARDNIVLVIFDPISSYLGKIDSHNNSDVRSVLDPLGEFAGRLRVAVVCNNHFSKGGGNANSRVIGSVAFVNQARAAFIVTPDEQDETRLLLIPSKMNIAPLSHGLAYRIEGCIIEHGGTSISTSRIMYESAPITLTANEALAALGDNNGDSKSSKAEATEFLLEALGAGPLPAKEVKKDAAEAGISPKSLRNAREALGIKPEKAGFDGGWVWALSKMPKEPQDARL